MRQALLRLGLTACTLILAACTTVPPVVTDLPARAEIREFALEARFALRIERPDEPPQSASGRLSWQHRRDADHILVSNPLGQGVAEIEQNAASARLRTSDGKVHQAPDAAALLFETTGYALPLGELPAWLLGRPTAAGRLQTDDWGRPRQLADAGWQIDYDYDSEAADALPSRLILKRNGDLEVRLRIEEWRNAP